MAAADDRRMSTRATGVVGIAILSSRVLGLVREMVFAGLFGAGRNLDAFLMAFRLPNLLRDLFAEGALSTAFITTFSKKIAVVLYGSEYWNEVLNLTPMAEWGAIAEQDLALLNRADTPAEAFECLRDHLVAHHLEPATAQESAAPGIAKTKG